MTNEWRPRLQKEIRDLQNEAYESNESSLPYFLDMKNHTFVPDKGQCEISFMVSLDDDVGETMTLQRAPSSRIVIFKIDASLIIGPGTTITQPSISYPFTEPKVTLTCGAGYFQSSASVSNGDILKIDNELWKPSLLVRDAALSIATQIRRSIRSGNLCLTVVKNEGAQPITPTSSKKSSFFENIRRMRELRGFLRKAEVDNDDSHPVNQSKAAMELRKIKNLRGILREADDTSTESRKQRSMKKDEEQGLEVPTLDSHERDDVWFTKSAEDAMIASDLSESLDEQLFITLSTDKEEATDELRPESMDQPETESPEESPTHNDQSTNDPAPESVSNPFHNIWKEEKIAEMNQSSHAKVRKVQKEDEETHGSIQQRTNESANQKDEVNDSAKESFNGITNDEKITDDSVTESMEDSVAESIENSATESTEGNSNQAFVNIMDSNDETITELIEDMFIGSNESADDSITESSIESIGELFSGLTDLEDINDDSITKSMGETTNQTCVELAESTIGPISELSKGMLNGRSSTSITSSTNVVHNGIRVEESTNDPSITESTNDSSITESTEEKLAQPIDETMKELPETDDVFIELMEEEETPEMEEASYRKEDRSSIDDLYFGISEEESLNKHFEPDESMDDYLSESAIEPYNEVLDEKDPSLESIVEPFNVVVDEKDSASQPAVEPFNVVLDQKDSADQSISSNLADVEKEEVMAEEVSHLAAEVGKESKQLTTESKMEPNEIAVNEDVVIGDIVNLDRYPFNDAHGLFPCKPMKRPEFIEDILTEGMRQVNVNVGLCNFYQN